MPTNRGTFDVASALANGTRAGSIESNSGSARVTPAPRRQVRRGRCFLVMNMVLPFLVRRLSLPIHLKRHTPDNLQHQWRKAIVVPRSLTRNRTNRGHIIIFNTTAEGVRE